MKSRILQTADFSNDEATSDLTFDSTGGMDSTGTIDAGFDTQVAEGENGVDYTIPVPVDDTTDRKSVV